MYLNNRFNNFIANPIEWMSCILNVILCFCMAYFYYDSNLYAPLFYSIFFFAYIFIVFLLGAKVIPFMYLLFILGATQDITFINCTGFFVCIFLAIFFPKQKYFIYSIYVLEIFLVCFRHEKSVWHLLCHFAFCFVFFLFAKISREKIEKDTIENEKNKIRLKVEEEIYEKIKSELKAEILEGLKPLDLTEGEEDILKQLADGKLLKEIEGVSKNTKTDYVENARIKNGCRTKNELIAMYSLRQKLPELFPSLFQDS